MMNKNNFIAIITIVAALSLSFSVATPVSAQDSMTMSTDDMTTGMDNMTTGMDNMTTGMDNATDNQTFTPISELPNDNTTNILNDTQRGLDANLLE